jgi:peptide/nickel transport system ATP-binding protein
MISETENILEVDQLITSFETERGLLRAVDHVSFSVPKGKTVGIVGESGCGKSVTAMSIVKLLPQPTGKILGGHIYFKGHDLVRATEKEIRAVRGAEIGVIFQEPMAALNPLHRVGRQVAEVFRVHRNLSKKAAWAAATEMLELVKIPAPEKRMMDYPHHLSGGMRQRIGIAIALACRPTLLIADEPTTALDVTVQAQILELLKSLQSELGMSTILITHDLGVIAETCDLVVVMYAGRVVERASAVELFSNPLHAYTRGLLNSIPAIDAPSKSILNTIPGTVASLADYAHSCRFCQRMGRTARASLERPRLIEAAPGHWVENCPECLRNIEHRTLNIER